MLKLELAFRENEWNSLGTHQSRVEFTIEFSTKHVVFFDRTELANRASTNSIQNSNAKI